MSNIPTINIAIAIVTDRRLVHQVVVYAKPEDEQREAFAHSVAVYAYNLLLEDADPVKHPNEAMINRSFCATSDEDQHLCHIALEKFDSFFVEQPVDEKG